MSASGSRGKSPRAASRGKSPRGKSPRGGKGSGSARTGEFAPHAMTGPQVCDHFGVDTSRGLSTAAVNAQRAKYGTNELTAEEGKSLFALILEQFDDLLVKILLLAAMVSFFLAYFDEDSAEGWTAYVEPVVILTILILNAIVGVWQEQNAENALAALKKLQPESALALRNNHWEKIEAADLVPGDIVELRVGDRVPADLRLLELKTTSLRIEQSQLTGESQSVSKEPESIIDASAEIQRKENMLFSSTAVSNGQCVAVVASTGMSTEIGKIQAAVQKAGEEEENTPLQQKLDDFGELLAKVIFVICAVVWVINYQHFFDPVHGSVFKGCIYYFKIAVALAVAAIPEGLPAVITTCLALGTRKMAKRNCIVRKLPSVETLGCTTVICSDKTGTLTTNEMVAVQFAVPVKKGGALKRFDVEGHSYAPIGEIQTGSGEAFTSIGAGDIAFQEFAKIGAMCNESRLGIDGNKWTRTGEPTEAAIRVLVEKMGCPNNSLNSKLLQANKRAKNAAQGFSDYWAGDLKKFATLEFDRARKSMSVLGQDKATKSNVLYVKGAPESVLDRCTTYMLPDGSEANLTDSMRDTIDEEISGMASSALRTLALAKRSKLPAPYSTYDGKSSHKAHKQINPDNFATIESDMCFVGVVGIMDPPRPECSDAIEDCKTAGITVIMITGDNKTTAEAISKKLGILEPGANMKQCSFTGAEFDKMNEAKQVQTLNRMVGSGGVFSRTEPTHKQAIVRILTKLGEITAMTGDGVNDAPALKQASIGIAMGIAGTEVAKEASDMILADDNFSSIVAAVEEGRSIYNNMKAFIRYMISSNIGEVASIFFTAALGMPEGLAPVQLLWVNLVTDGPPATALGFNPPDLGAMKKPPRRKDDMLISGWVFFRYMVIGTYVGVATVGIFAYWYVLDSNAPDGHSLVSMGQLMDWGHCAEGSGIWSGFKASNYIGLPEGVTIESDPCRYFREGKVKPSTLSLTVLVVIEMLNALNALSEDGSLIHMPPWKNPYLILAILTSIGIHMIILYVPWLTGIFQVCALDQHDWWLVMAFSIPVILIDEVLKFFGRLTAVSARRGSDKLKEE